jgi:D-alanine-D-alanine ligase
VLFGGQSSEHEVSLASARSVMRAMDPDKYEVVPIGITKGGAWLTSGDPMQQLRSGEASSLLQLTDGEDAVSELSTRFGEFDVIFPVLHGPMGEDGTVQGLLELAGIPYVGSGVLGSAVGMDKAMMKDDFRARGLPVAPYLVVTRKQWESSPQDVQREAERLLTYPMFAKPSNMGSSVGVSKIHDASEFAAALDIAARYDRRMLIEQGLDARECECAVLGNDRPEASVVGEIVPGNEFYDYRAKYVDDNSTPVIPAEIPDRVSKEIRRLAVEAFRAVDAAGMARVDFFVERDFSGVWLNELNTIPGFTRISMYPKLWEASGLTYSDLISRLIELAIERSDDSKQSREALSDPGGDLDV